MSEVPLEELPRATEHLVLASVGRTDGAGGRLAFPSCLTYSVIACSLRRMVLPFRGGPAALTAPVHSEPPGQGLCTGWEPAVAG